MRVLVTGAKGMLGRQVIRDAPETLEVVPTARADTDLADEAQVDKLFDNKGPFDGVIHCAGFAHVDRAEEEEAEALRENAGTTQVVAARCARDNTPLVVVSSDYVFDGRADRPYLEDDAPAPLNAYGRSKLETEVAALREWRDGVRIVRTAWLYGANGDHFPGKILEVAKTQKLMQVVDDQRGSPTSTAELAPALWDALRLAPPGLYHAACEGEATWYQVARATLEFMKIEGVTIMPCTTAEYPRPATRPVYSVLNSGRLQSIRGRALAPWRDALEDYLRGEQ